MLKSESYCVDFVGTIMPCQGWSCTHHPDGCGSQVLHSGAVVWIGKSWSLNQKKRWHSVWFWSRIIWLLQGQTPSWWDVISCWDFWWHSGIGSTSLPTQHFQQVWHEKPDDNEGVFSGNIDSDVSIWVCHKREYNEPEHKKGKQQDQRGCVTFMPRMWSSIGFADDHVGN